MNKLSQKEVACTGVAIKHSFLQMHRGRLFRLETHHRILHETSVVLLHVEPIPMAMATATTTTIIPNNRKYLFLDFESELNTTSPCTMSFRTLSQAFLSAANATRLLRASSSTVNSVMVGGGCSSPLSSTVDGGVALPLSRSSLFTKLKLNFHSSVLVLHTHLAISQHY